MLSLLSSLSQSLACGKRLFTAALATSASSCGFTPDTPQAPMILPCAGSTMGTPPSISTRPDVSNAARSPPLDFSPFTAASKSFVSRLKRMADRAFSVAISAPIGIHPSMRCNAIKLPPASQIATVTFQPDFSAAAMPARTACSAPVNVTAELGAIAMAC
eukprot:Skav231141  [mRNA]  locus=scaffold2333:63593:64548:- [translate_table: standard]